MLFGDTLILEREARFAGHGIWSDAIYRVRDASETPQHLDSFRLVEGRIADSAEVCGPIYLNFEVNWRSDFTVTIFPNDRR